LGGLNTLSPGDEKIGKMMNTIGALFGYLLFGLKQAARIRGFSRK
jgi:hypothetical protein